MKKALVIIFLSVISFQLSAQNEGRIGLFQGVSKTSLYNKDDASFGDYLPTIKPTVGIDAGYHFTLFHVLPMGFSLQFSRNSAGQNYRGFYTDSTSYYAYTRLTYLRTGLALHMGTNPRRQVSLDFTYGANIGFLTNYQERYEIIRYNNDRYILNIKNSDVAVHDTSDLKGTLTSPLYNKTDLNVFGSLGLNFLIAKNWVFGFYGRLDYGLSPVENTQKINVNYDTQPSTSDNFKIFNTKVKYHGPTDDLVTHSATNNIGYGMYLTLKYRIYNKEKIEFYYKENKTYNHQ